MKKSVRSGGLLQSGIVLSFLGLLAQIIHYGFQMIISAQFVRQQGEFGLVLTTITFIGLLSLPSTIAIQAVTHYVARFHFSGDDDRLHALLAGCRKVLFQITLAGSIIAIILIKPLAYYFEIPRLSLMLIALVCVLGGLWNAYLTALCQGLGWFKRLALISLLAAVVRIAFGWPATHVWPVAECAVMASALMLLPNLILFFWKDDFPRRRVAVTSPWNREFIFFLVVSGAYVFGSYCFTQADLLVARKFFAKESLDAYGSAGLLARALPTVAGPLLAVLFTHRSGRHHGDGLRDQMKLVGLYAAGLILGGIALFVLRDFCLQLLHRNTPEAAAMIGPLAVTMAIAGLLQALANWALASRWMKVSLLYGVLGVIYWLVLLWFGRTPAALLHMMPLAVGVAFVLMLVFWLKTMRRHHPPAQS